jgi:deoxycytidine triphosphate deaminase
MKSAQVNLTEPCKDDISVNVRYSVIHPSCFHPSKQENSPGIDIPIQQEVFLPPNGCETVDTGIQLVLPGNLCAQLIPHSSSSHVNLHIHSGPVDSNYSSTIKLLLRNNSQSPVKISPEPAWFRRSSYHSFILLSSTSQLFIPTQLEWMTVVTHPNPALDSDLS